MRIFEYESLEPPPSLLEPGGPRKHQKTCFQYRTNYTHPMLRLSLQLLLVAEIAQFKVQNKHIFISTFLKETIRDYLAYLFFVDLKSTIIDIGGFGPKVWTCTKSILLGRILGGIFRILVLPVLFKMSCSHP